MGRTSQRKGSNGEKELVGLLQNAGYTDVIQPPQPTYGKRPDVEGLDGVHIEVKRKERISLYEAMEQAQADALKFRDGVPCVFHRRNRKPWLVVMKFSDWLEMYKHSRLQGDFSEPHIK